MRYFERYMENFSEVQGWFEEPAIALWDCLLSLQEQTVKSGDLVEIGIWKGKSAALLALHCEVDESCVFIDTKPTDEARLHISKVVPEARCIYIRSNSRHLKRLPEMRDYLGRVRWVHIDGEHTSEAVTIDLHSADTLLGPEGIVAIDDFLSPAYPQVTRAVFQYLIREPYRFSLVLCGFNKGYLCRPAAARVYLEFIKQTLFLEMSSRGFDDITLWKTAEPTDMNCFGITSRYRDFNYRGLDWNPSSIAI
jgi:hypothetical protein